MTKFKTYQLSIELFHEFQKLKMPTYLHDQLLRASSSITLNLAEGSGKRTPNDQRKFYYQAFGSYRECRAIIDLMKIKDEKLIKLLNKTGAHIWKLLNHYNKKVTPNNQRPTSNAQHPTTAVADNSSS